MKPNLIPSMLFTVMVTFLTAFNAYAFTAADIYEAIIASHQDDEKVSEIQKVPGSNNRWSMKFQTVTAEKEGQKSTKIGIPTELKYAGSKIHISQQLAKVDARVLDAVLHESDVESKLEKLKQYDAFMSELTGFSGKVNYDGERMRFDGSISVAGKTMDAVKTIIVELRNETADLYYLIDEANVEALRDYFEKVHDKEYGAILDAQTFVEVMGYGFTVANQVKRRESEIGHWAWNVGDVQTETINHGRMFEETFLLHTGTDLSQYKQEQLYADLNTRVRTRLPKGAKSAVIRPHAYKKGETVVVLQYPLNKSPDGEEILSYHEKFIAFVENIAPDLREIVGKYTASVVTQTIKSLSAREFMELMNDGLENLKRYEAEGADGQWKFKFKNVAYIITNYPKHMILSFIANVPTGRKIEDIIDNVEADIERNFSSFADAFEVTSYNGNQRVVWVKMRFNYGLLSSSEITGKRLKERYDQFTHDIAPELQSRL